MPNIQFDIEGARKHGYTDTEIADAMASKAGFDTAAARSAGFQDHEIIARLSTNSAAPRHVDAPVAKSATQQAYDKVADETGTGESILIGAGHTFDRVGKGMQQLYYGATGNTKAQADLKARADSEEEAYRSLTDKHPFATAVGESLPSMVVPVGGAGASAAKAAGRLAVSAAVPAAAEYGTAGERAGHAAGAAAGAVIGGVVIPKAAGAIVEGGKAALKGLAGKISPEALALAERAKQLGIPVNLAQLSDSKFLKVLSSSLEQMPFTGAVKTVNTQRKAFTSAVAKTFGSTTDTISPEVYAAERKRLGAQFDDLAARNTLDVTGAVKSKLDGIVNAAEQTASDDTIRAMNNIRGRLTEQAKVTGGHVPAKVSTLVDEAGNPLIKEAAQNLPSSVKIPGATYSSIDSELSNIIKAGGEKGMYAKQMQTAIREAMDGSISPADQALWTETRTQYKNLKAVRDIIAKEVGDGNVPPTQLMHALNNSDAGKEAMALGKRGTLGELGQIGKRFVRDPVPNSGTAQRALAMSLIGGGSLLAGADPKTAAGMVLGGATAGRLLNKVINNPKVIEAVTRQGLSMADLAKMPPAKLTQFLGGVVGQATVRDLEK